MSFWGGLDPETGVITDRNHPQHGESIAGRVLMLERTRGSTSSPGTLVEAIRRGKGPVKIVIGEPDMAIISAAFVARVLYGIDVPVVVDHNLGSLS
ncbi:MAG: aconitase X swivel domain-containing protein [Woeseiaceae bacterium]